MADSPGDTGNSRQHPEGLATTSQGNGSNRRPRRSFSKPGKRWGRITQMQPSDLQYLPISPLYFSALIGLFVIVLLLIQIGAIRYAYLRLGVSSGAALALLLGSLIGSYFNVPIAQIPGEQVLSGREVYFFGMRYVVPVVVHWPGTVVAVNVGGAIIPTIMSAYLLLKHQLWASGSVAVAILTIACYLIAQPVPGIGIALPVFVPALVTGIVAVLLSREHAAQLAYIAGSLGTLIGADLLNLGSISGLGAPVMSIGGAGTFDGIFLTGILAVLLASLTGRARSPSA